MLQTGLRVCRTRGEAFGPKATVCPQQSVAACRYAREVFSSGLWANVAKVVLTIAVNRSADKVTSQWGLCFDWLTGSGGEMLPHEGRVLFGL